MRALFIVLMSSFVCGNLFGCAQSPQRPLPEVPGLQQYYQMPGNYYTAPPPRLKYWNPDQHPDQGKKMNFRDQRRSDVLRDKVHSGGTKI